MICVACGGDVPVGSRFCPRCGRVTTAPEGSSPPAGAAPPSPPPPPPPAPTPPSFGPPPGGPGAYPSQPYGGTTGGPVAEGLATFGERVGSVFIDGFILWVVMAVGFLIAGQTVPAAEPFEPTPGPSGLGSLIILITSLAGPAYYVLLEGRPDGQTIGKKAVGIRAVRKTNGAPLGYGLAIGRYLARFADIFTLGLGLLWAAWDPMRQTFHDKIAGTLVVKASVYPPPPKAGNAPPGS